MTIPLVASRPLLEQAIARTELRAKVLEERSKTLKEFVPDYKRELSILEQLKFLATQY